MGKTRTLIRPRPSHVDQTLWFETASEKVFTDVEA
jgi:hypothetical protein